MINTNSPKAEGYKACCLGKHRESNPYLHIQHFMKFEEWDSGWYQAFNEHKYGVKE